MGHLIASLRFKKDMRRIISTGVFLLLFLSFSAFEAHKFYVSIYQIHHNPEKKRLQITTRIFMDALNAVLYQNYHRKTHIGEDKETPEDVVLMNKYLFNHFHIKVNGKRKDLTYRSMEREVNVIISYYTVLAVSKVKMIEVENSVLMDLTSEQQNIIQTTINGKKESLLLTSKKTKGVLE